MIGVWMISFRDSLWLVAEALSLEEEEEPITRTSMAEEAEEAEGEVETISGVPH
jgi:hypothetical protein